MGYIITTTLRAPGNKIIKRYFKEYLTITGAQFSLNESEAQMFKSKSDAQSHLVWAGSNAVMEEKRIPLQ